MNSVLKRQEIVSVNGFVVSIEFRAQQLLQEAQQELDCLETLKKDIKTKSKTIIRKRSI